MSSAVGIMAIKFDKTATKKRVYFTYGHTTDSMVRMTQTLIQITEIPVKTSDVFY